MNKLRDTGLVETIPVKYAGIEYKVEFVYSAEWKDDEWEIEFDPVDQWDIEPKPDDLTDDMSEVFYDAAIEWTFDNIEQIAKHFESDEYKHRLKDYKYYEE